MEGSVALDDNLKRALEDLQSTITAHVDERYSETQKRLDSLEERGTSVNDQKVVDLEKRLDERDEQIGELKEQVRLLKVDGGLVKAPSSEKPDFKGVFLPRISDEDLRAFIAQNHDSPGVERRAIDSSLLTSGGALQAETAAAFIDLVVSQTTTLSRITNIIMGAPIRNLDELKVAERQLVAPTEGTAPSVADAITTDQHVLTAKGVIWAEDITLEFLEDNIEKGAVEAAIASKVAKQFGSDLNDLAWNGDESTGTFLVLNKGFSVLFQADADVNDADLTGLTTAVACLNKILRTMPAKFMAIPDLVHFAPVGFCQYYADEFAARATAGGDQVMVNGFPALRYFGRPVIPEPHMKETTAGIATEQKIVLAPASMLAHGIYRNIRVDAQWSGRKRAMEYTLTARVDTEYATGEVVVLGDSLPAGLQ